MTDPRARRRDFVTIYALLFVAGLGARVGEGLGIGFWASMKLLFFWPFIVGYKAAEWLAEFV